MRAVELLREHGIESRPVSHAVTPWTTPRDLLDIVDFVAAYDLLDIVDFVAAYDLLANVDPVRYTIRLLVPDGSLLKRDDLREHLGPTKSRLSVDLPATFSSRLT